MAACVEATPRAPVLSLPRAFEAPSRGPSLPAASLDHWWRLYNDPQLTALVEEALAGGFDAKVAAARLEQARAVRKEQGYQLNLPSGALNASGGHASAAQGSTGQAVDGVNSVAANFGVSWEVDLFGRRATGDQIAKADLHTAEFTAEAARWALAAQVADNLFAARGLAIQLAEAQQTLRIQGALDAAARAKVDHGLVPASDGAQTRANLEATQAQVEGFRSQLDAARRAVLLLVGRATDPLADLPVQASVGMPPPPPVAVPGDLLARRPDVREAQWRLASAAGQLRAARLALFPTFTLSPGYGVTRITGADAFGAWTLGASAVVPVLDAPRLLQAVRAQRAVSEEQVLAYEHSVQTAYVEAETALGYLDSDTRRAGMLARAEGDAALAYEAKREGYQRGFNDLQTALAAEAAWRQTRQDLAAAQVTALQRSVQVFKAIGGGWSPDPAAIQASPSAALAPATLRARAQRAG
jgi:NodT family efflux transporter outer membrane factor (OMF) lipoprotein